MSWVFLATAILFEVSGTTAMKLSEGLTRLVPTILLLVFYGISFIFLALALKRLEVSVAYAIWSGVGTAAIALIGYAWFQEPMSPFKVGCLVLIITGVVGLNLSERGIG